MDYSLQETVRFVVQLQQKRLDIPGTCPMSWHYPLKSL
jgi:hypothetical protein